MTVALEVFRRSEVVYSYTLDNPRKVAWQGTTHSPHHRATWRLRPP